MAYRRTATAEFAIYGTDQTITISNVPYLWMPAANPDMDQEGLFAVKDWMRAKLTGRLENLSLIYVSTSPVGEPS
jgi:hypothetical protein